MEQTQLHLSFCGLTGKRKGISIFVPPTHTHTCTYVDMPSFLFTSNDFEAASVNPA